MYLIYGFSHDYVYPGNDMVLFLIFHLYGISDMIDAYTYIFMKENVRELLIKTIHRFYLRICCHDIQKEGTEEILPRTTFIGRENTTTCIMILNVTCISFGISS